MERLMVSLSRKTDTMKLLPGVDSKGMPLRLSLCIQVTACKVHLKNNQEQPNVSIQGMVLPRCKNTIKPLPILNCGAGTQKSNQAQGVHMCTCASQGTVSR